MTPVILTPILFAEADVVTAGALFLIGLGIGAVVMYFVGLSARSRYQSATQQLANLQGQNLKQRAATVGIPQGEAPNAPLPPKKTGLPPKKEKPKDETASSEDLQQLQSQIESLNDQNATLLLQVEAEQQQRALELQRISELEQSIANQATAPPAAPETTSEQQ